MAKESITYGLGGYDPEHPNCNVVEKLVDNEDGTGEIWRYNPDGSSIPWWNRNTGLNEDFEPVTGLYVEPPPEVDPVVQRAAEQALAGMVIAISEDHNVSETTRAWALAWRSTVGV